MLHPSLGSPPDPVPTWQVDTQEIGDLAVLYARRLAGERDPDQLARRLGVLWKKLAAAPRLASLIVGFAQLQMQAAQSPRSGVQPGKSRPFGRILAAIGWTTTRQTALTLPDYSEGDPLYDRWVDG
jgi:hypothetical protein